MPKPRRAAPEKLDTFAAYLSHVADVVDYVSDESAADLPDGFVVTSVTRRVQIYVTPEFWTGVPAGRIASLLDGWSLAKAIAARNRLTVTTAGIEPPVVECGDCRTPMQGSAYLPDPQYCATCRPSRD